MDLKILINEIESKGNELGLKAMIGGSYALKNVYGVLNRPTDDIDIILIAKPNLHKKGIGEKVLSIIKSLFPLENLKAPMKCYPEAETYINTKVECVLNYGKTTVNFILHKEFNWSDWNSKVSYEGMSVIPLMNILRAKGDYNRDKDKLDLFSITQKITGLSKNTEGDTLPF